MSEKKKTSDIHVFSGEKVKLIMEREGISSQVEFCKRLPGNSGEDSECPKTTNRNYMNGIINNRIELSDKMARKIIRAFPKYRLEWLLGKDPYPTNAEYNGAQIEKLMHKTNLERELLEKVCSSVADLMQLHGLEWDGIPPAPEWKEIDSGVLRRSPLPTVATFDGVSFQAWELVAIASKLFVTLRNEIDFFVDMKKQLAFNAAAEKGMHDLKISVPEDLQKLLQARRSASER